MAAKKQNNRRGTAKTTSKKKNTRKRTAKDQGVASGFQTEIILWIFFAASIILIISNLGMGGTVGGSISQASFGIMGLLAYLFPVLLFGCAVFFISNRKNPLAYKKLLAGLVFWIFLCGLVQLLTEGYMAETTFAEYYRISSSYHTGGGVIGGAICISTTSAFGTVGGCVIILLVLLITLILITQKSFLVLFSVSGMLSVQWPETDMHYIWKVSRSVTLRRSSASRSAGCAGNSGVQRE